MNNCKVCYKLQKNFNIKLTSNVLAFDSDSYIQIPTYNLITKSKLISSNTSSLNHRIGTIAPNNGYTAIELLDNQIRQ